MSHPSPPTTAAATLADADAALDALLDAGTAVAASAPGTADRPADDSEVLLAQYLIARLPAESPPEALIARLHAEAERHSASMRTERPVAVNAAPRQRDRSRGWALAAGLAMITVTALLAALRDPVSRDHGFERPVSTAALTAEWQAASGAPGAAQVRGTVRWDGARQTGRLELAGLPANDPARAQYQLWVFDADRDNRYPVDGGVFDAPAAMSLAASSQTLALDFHPRLPVHRPTLFVVTLEPAGGVVVSDRTRVIGSARPASGDSSPL